MLDLYPATSRRVNFKDSHVPVGRYLILIASHQHVQAFEAGSQFEASEGLEGAQRQHPCVRESSAAVLHVESGGQPVQRPRPTAASQLKGAKGAQAGQTPDPHGRHRPTMRQVQGGERAAEGSQTLHPFVSHSCATVQDERIDRREVGQ
eukprot:251189-Prorocentrum_minimum.AAC.2